MNVAAGRHVMITIYDAAKTQRALVFVRDDGSFGFQHERFAEPEGCWIPAGDFPEAYCDTLQAAEREACDRVPWLRTAPAPAASTAVPRRARRRRVVIREVYFNAATGLHVIPDLPPERDYALIYRDAMSVRWDGTTRAIYMVARPGRSKLDAFRQIVASVASEYGDRLVLTPQTWWSGVSSDERADISATQLD